MVQTHMTGSLLLQCRQWERIPYGLADFKLEQFAPVSFSYKQYAKHIIPSSMCNSRNTCLSSELPLHLARPWADLVNKRTFAILWYEGEQDHHAKCIL